MDDIRININKYASHSANINKSILEFNNIISLMKFIIECDNIQQFIERIKLIVVSKDRILSDYIENNTYYKIEFGNHTIKIQGSMKNKYLKLKNFYFLQPLSACDLFIKEVLNKKEFKRELKLIQKRNNLENLKAMVSICYLKIGKFYEDVAETYFTEHGKRISYTRHEIDE
jgi:HJR/Mrr/RecB family endonuclease